MKKTIVCFGDSNTYGYNGFNAGRYDETQRWTGLLARQLGDGYYIAEEGLNGRTVLTDPGHKGWEGLSAAVPCLKKHSPVELFILMLGTNDTKASFHRQSQEITEGIIEIIEKLKRSAKAFQNRKPRILLIAPAPVEVDGEDACKWEDMGMESAKKSRELILLYEQAARRNQCHFLRAGDYAAASQADGVHLDEEGHRRLAAAVADRVIKIMTPGACPCVRTNCPRHGSCGDCLTHHQGKMPPYCEKGRRK